MVAARAVDAPGTDPGPKPDDRGDERARRRRALARVHGALEVEAELRVATAAQTIEATETAAWLGASLADLAAVTGHSRQAARKRWPTLGPIARRRRWLGYHVDEVLWGADLAGAHVGVLPVEGLADEVAAARATFEREDDEDPTARWRALDDLVDRRLRAVADTPTPGLDEAAEFARHGCAGIVGYYDHAVSAERP